MNILETTLCLLKRNNKILLAMKKRGFGKGLYNGVGGKIKKGEIPELYDKRYVRRNIC